ncbi:DUF309 domain-containing protein [Brevibacillus centrosporus]|uniref:DUF309 domain-containing protein n=1 Tax=Brevibacillus centrosporus TaxID=54910 RepID=UPI000F09AED8|nr:DUF309 domain-containing protein [Brevibacillus centrosporus]MEC2128263.1 DUF309 domain-containing protein [Brevibacillus centrosporus]MED4909684.1 DUF309 domain-containing protein [Brevibacillus centrosporus]RNB73882.1 DUF309 domain-containing protein [Brevibacillus centrosporus]GED30724.1 hypothetical protein BCE02nite_18650 [Brevibacillus centrosporus]
MYPQPYLDYLVQFHVERDYFECHEILEEYWKSVPQEQRQIVWVGLIQIAVGLYHQRRGNLNGAKKMLTSAHSILEHHPEDVLRLGLDHAALMLLLEKRLEELNNGLSYHSMSLPILAADLREAYERACALRDVPVTRESDLNDHYLLNKHTLRDRSEVFAERARQLQLRERQRSEPGS